jgi:cytochrome c oxidase assembly protein subunit 11
MKMGGANATMLRKLLVIIIGMFGFGYALVPLYNAICEATGINVLALSEKVSSVAFAKPVNTQVDDARDVSIEFDANVQGPYGFKPEVASMVVHPGQLVTVQYEFKNLQNKAVVVQAIPSYAPKQAMAYFNKVNCFCFSQHEVAANETKVWPVTFVVDSKLPKDMQTITLSYTFFEVGGTQKTKAVVEVAKPKVNL